MNPRDRIGEWVMVGDLLEGLIVGVVVLEMPAAAKRPHEFEMFKVWEPAIDQTRTWAIEPIMRFVSLKQLCI